MACHTPEYIGGVYNDVPNRFQQVSCGNCPGCRQQRSAQWCFRLEKQMDHCTSAFFITLTYSNEHLVWTDHGATLHKEDFQLFMKRLRKESNKWYDDCEKLYNPETKKIERPKIKYYMVGEYSPQLERPHYHAIVYNLPLAFGVTGIVQEKWGKGWADVKRVHQGSIRYVTNYVQKPRLTEDILGNRLLEYSEMSQGLGLNYLTPEVIYHLQRSGQNYVVFDGGKKCGMPQYYRNKVWEGYNGFILDKDEQQEELWNRQMRYKMNCRKFARENLNTRDILNDEKLFKQWVLDQRRKEVQKYVKTRQG